MAKNQNPSSDEIKTVIQEAEKLTGFQSEKTVPAQTAPENSTEEQDSGVDMEEGDKMIPEAVEPKKSFGERLKPLTATLKKNRKGIILTLAVVGAATVAVAKFAAKTVVEETVSAEKISDMPDEELAKVEGIEDVEEAKKNA
jgi:hypothetical protein